MLEDAATLNWPKKATKLNPPVAAVVPVTPPNRTPQVRTIHNGREIQNRIRNVLCSRSCPKIATEAATTVINPAPTTEFQPKIDCSPRFNDDDVHHIETDEGE